jgi:hypothetical protein
MTELDTSASTGLVPAIDAPPTFTELVYLTLTATWHTIRQHHPDAPEVVLAFGAGTSKHRPGETRWGHFAANRWEDRDRNRLHELFVSGEALELGAGHVLTTLLHEASHGVAQVRGIADTSRAGRYHNQRFKTLGEELGLTVARAGSNGWAGTTLAPGTALRYSAELDQLTAAITAYRRAEVADARGGRGGGGNLLVTVCDCPRKIRVARSTLELGSIWCGICDAQFTEMNTEGSEAA